MGEARPASFSNQGCPTDYNSDYIPSHHEYCCTSDYFLMVNLGSTFLVLDLSIAPKNTPYALFFHLILRSIYLHSMYLQGIYLQSIYLHSMYLQSIYLHSMYLQKIYCTPCICRKYIAQHIFAQHVFAEHFRTACWCSFPFHFSQK